MELASWIDARFTLPAPDVPDLSGNAPETAAQAVRAAWGLGERPVRNMVHLLEAHGVRVFSLAEECREVDAFSLWWDGVPYVFLNTQKSAERSRLDAAHELGHLVLHRGPRGAGRDLEREAQRFGGAFLMPKASVLASVSGLATVPRLIALKRNWNVAVTALTYRLHELQLISDWHYRTLFTQLSERGYRINEPNPAERETSQLLQKVFDILRQEGISKDAVARDLHVLPEEINALVFGLVMLPLSGGRTKDSQRRSQPPTSLTLIPPKRS
jgi:Zn-dependent peptidase ImmA (M78 family)